MALTFPISASIGQTYQSGSSNTYEWTGTYWKIKNITTANFVGNTQYNIDSASFLQKIAQGTNEQDLSYLATTGSNTFYGSQTIYGDVAINNSGRILIGNPTANTVFGLYDGVNILGPYYQLFGNQYPVLSQRGGAEFVYDTRNGGDGNFHIASFDGSYFKQRFRVDDTGAQLSGSFVVSGSIIPIAGEGTYTSSFSLGSVTNAWKDLYISHGSIIFVDAQTQETSSFSITTDPGVGQNTVKYTAAITASQYLGDGGNLTNLPSNTNWNKYKMYTIAEGEQLTFSGDYILENSYLQILSEGLNSIGDWIELNVSGDGTMTRTGNNTYRIVGPNDQNGSGWLYIKRFFDTATTMVIPYVWTTNDGANDWPMYQFSSEEPTGEMDNTNRLQGGDPNTSYEAGTWTINVPANSWLAIGVYSNDSEAGPGTLNITLPYILREDVQYSPGKYFKKEGSIFIGGNLLLKDSTILNNGKISVGGEVILIGDSQITGTGTII